MRERSLSHQRADERRARVLEERAWQMRHRPTDSEARLFEALRGGKARRAVSAASTGGGAVHRGFARSSGEARRRGRWRVP